MFVSVGRASRCCVASAAADLGVRGSQAEPTLLFPAESGTEEDAPCSDGSFREGEGIGL